MIELRTWTKEDIQLLVRLNSPEMTEHIGGPETLEQVERRLKKYVAAQSDVARMFRVITDGVPVGSVGFWDKKWMSEQVYETGWGILPEFQGRGIASAATAKAIEIARASGRRDSVHAFPSVDNGPSNAICRKLGFELLGESQFEYPKGHWMRCNDWRLSLA